MGIKRDIIIVDIKTKSTIFILIILPFLICFFIPFPHYQFVKSSILFTIVIFYLFFSIYDLLCLGPYERNCLVLFFGLSVFSFLLIFASSLIIFNVVNSWRVFAILYSVSFFYFYILYKRRLNRWKGNLYKIDIDSGAFNLADNTYNPVLSYTYYKNVNYKNLFDNNRSFISKNKDLIGGLAVAIFVVLPKLFSNKINELMIGCLLYIFGFFSNILVVNVLYRYNFVRRWQKSTGKIMVIENSMS